MNVKWVRNEMNGCEVKETQVEIRVCMNNTLRRDSLLKEEWKWKMKKDVAIPWWDIWSIRRWSLPRIAVGVGYWLCAITATKHSQLKVDASRLGFWRCWLTFLHLAVGRCEMRSGRLRLGVFCFKLTALAQVPLKLVGNTFVKGEAIVIPHPAIPVHREPLINCNYI